MQSSLRLRLMRGGEKGVPPPPPLDVGPNLWLFEAWGGRSSSDTSCPPSRPSMGGGYLATRPQLPRWVAYALVLSILLAAALLSPLSFALLFHV